jgi:alkylhydroperoxidase family enzyme
MFTPREKAALELTEAGTRLADNDISDALWKRVAEHFTDTELAELLWTITVVNAWNRLGATARPWPLT